MPAARRMPLGYLVHRHDDRTGRRLSVYGFVRRPPRLRARMQILPLSGTRNILTSGVQRCLGSDASGQLYVETHGSRYDLIPFFDPAEIGSLVDSQATRDQEQSWW